MSSLLDPNGLRTAFAEKHEEISETGINWFDLNSISDALVSVEVSSADNFLPRRLHQGSYLNKFNRNCDHIVTLEFSDPEQAMKSYNIIKRALYGSRLDYYFNKNDQGTFSTYVDLDIKYLVLLDQIVSTSLTIPVNSDELDERWQRNLEFLSDKFDVDDCLAYSKRSTPAWLTWIAMEYSREVYGTERNGSALSDGVAGHLLLSRVAEGEKADIMVPDPDLYLRQVIYKNAGVFESLISDVTAPVREMRDNFRNVTNGNGSSVEAVRKVITNDLIEGPKKWLMMTVFGFGTWAIKAVEYTIRKKINDEKNRKCNLETDKDNLFVHPDINIRDKVGIRDALYDYKLRKVMECKEVRRAAAKIGESLSTLSDEELLSFRKNLNGDYGEKREALKDALMQNHKLKNNTALYFIRAIEERIAEKIYDQRTDRIAATAERNGTEGHILPHAERIRERMKSERGLGESYYNGL